MRPRRSPDQAFLATATELAGPSGRVGMVMKSTSFFSKDIHAVESRAAILKRLAPTALINLSYLSADSGAAASALDCVAESAARPSSGGGMPPRAYCGFLTCGFLKAGRRVSATGRNGR